MTYFYIFCLTRVILKYDVEQLLFLVQRLGPDFCVRSVLTATVEYPNLTFPQGLRLSFSGFASCSAFSKVPPVRSVSMCSELYMAVYLLHF